MIHKETCQPDNTIVIENIIRLSRECGIQMVVDFELHNKEKCCVGILKDVVLIHGIPVLYLCQVISGKDSVETHALIPVSRIEAITFETQKGFLDNLIK